MDLAKRRLLVEHFCTLEGPPIGESILTAEQQEWLRRAREIDPDPVPPFVNAEGQTEYNYDPLYKLIETVRGTLHRFNLGPLFTDAMWGKGRLCRMRPAEALCEMLMQERRSATGPQRTVDVRRFFDGNDDRGSIAPNLATGDDAVSLEYIRETLLTLASHPSTIAVGVSIDDLPNLDHEGDDGVWPYAERAFVWTTEGLKSIRSCLKSIRPDSITKVALRTVKEPEGVTVPPKTKVYSVWWD